MRWRHPVLALCSISALAPVCAAFLDFGSPIGAVSAAAFALGLLVGGFL